MSNDNVYDPSGLFSNYISGYAAEPNSVQVVQEPTVSPLRLNLGLNALNLSNTQRNINDFGAAAQNYVNQYMNPGSGTARYNTKYGIEPRFWSSLSSANAAMKAAGLGTFTVSSGWRSNAQQRKLYADFLSGKKKANVAKPGTSKHEYGLAADLNLTKAQQRWLEANGARFGIGRIKGESWHWQPTYTLGR